MRLYFASEVLMSKLKKVKCFSCPKEVPLFHNEEPQNGGRANIICKNGSKFNHNTFQVIICDSCLSSHKNKIIKTVIEY